MKTLYESILSSTNSGGAARIREWWESNKYFTDKGKYRIENIGGKFFIIMDEFERQPSQTSVEIQGEYLVRMPKQLSGIYYMYYSSKNEKGLLRPVNLHFTRCNRCKIDLSDWDMSLGPIGRLDVHILIAFSTPDVELVGLPKYKSEFNVQFSHCGEIKGIHDINAPLGEIEFGYDNGGYNLLDYANIKNCTLREFFVNKADIIRSTASRRYDPNVEFYKKIKGKFVIDPQYADCITELLANNTIGMLRYQYSKSLDDKKMRGYGGMKLEPYEVGYCLKTYAIVPIK